MDLRIENSKNLPRIYYGMHMVEGVAEYRPKDKEPYRVLLRNETIKKMNPTFAGVPLYVQHVSKVDLDKLQETADGYVIESFFNPADGKHWAKFIVVSDRGHRAVEQKFKLSNCYIMKDVVGGGTWNGVDYKAEVMSGHFEHLALVTNNRYESIILTPDEFKQYNDNLILEVKKVANSKEENGPMFKFFKKERVENSTDLTGMHVTLPKSGKEISIEMLVKNADESEVKKSSPVMCNGDERVKIDEQDMSVNELIEKHKTVSNELAELKKANSDAAEAEKAKANSAPAEDEKKKENEDDKKEKENEAEEKKLANSKHFNALKDAGAHSAPRRTVEISQDLVARGKSRYGSN